MTIREDYDAIHRLMDIWGVPRIAYDGETELILQGRVTVMRKEFQRQVAFLEQRHTEIQEICTAETKKRRKAEEKLSVAMELTRVQESALAEAQRKLKGAYADLREVDQTLGRALGYPRYCDDQKNFPGTTDADGVCTGEHVPPTLAAEAARKLAEARERERRLRERLKDALERAKIHLDHEGEPCKDRTGCDSDDCGACLVLSALDIGHNWPGPTPAPEPQKEDQCR